MSKRQASKRFRGQTPYIPPALDPKKIPRISGKCGVNLPALHPHRGKLAFPNEKEAKKGLASAQKRRRPGDPHTEKRYYAHTKRNGGCGYFHLTSWSIERLEQEERSREAVSA